MSARTWKLIAGYGLLTATVLLCLHLVSLAPLWLGWGRELLAATIAIVALVVGLRFGRAHVPDTGSVRDAKPEPLAAIDTGPASASSALSMRELDVLRLLAEGLSNKEMARTLSVSENTVKTHLANIYGKLQVSRRTEALAVARRQGLIGG